ncbi:MAG: YihY/virulence factor BrkB family protein [Thermoflavifilum sp.]|nr:YihY/virulence factor BrkB family protein [Thermoflavifilum sp.]
MKRFNWIKKNYVYLGIQQCVRLCNYIYLQTHPRISLYDISRFLFREIVRDKLFDKAAAVAFFFILAIPPGFIFLCTLLPYIPLKGLENSIYTLLHDITPNQRIYQLVRNVIYDFLHTPRAGLLSFSFLFSIISSSTGVLSIMRSFEKTYPGFKKRSFLQSRITAIKITSLLILLVLGCLILIVAQRIILKYVFEALGIHSQLIRIIVDVVRWILILMLFFTIYSLIYTYGPYTDQRWKFVTPGSWFSTLLTIVTTLGFSYYVNHFNSYNRIYGSIGTILVMMIWVYLNSIILLLGFELNASLRIIEQQQSTGENNLFQGHSNRST